VLSQWIRGRERKKKKMGPGGESGRDPQEREAATGKGVQGAIGRRHKNDIVRAA
jgi:hypothetical protein